MTGIDTIDHLPSDQAVEAAFELLIERSERQRHTAYLGQVCAVLLRDLRRTENAYMNARLMWRAGYRPERTHGDAWTLYSRSGGEPHILVIENDDWVCSCPAGRSAHWAAALMIAIEVAGDIDANCRF
jgi:hypothetical protein